MNDKHIFSEYFDLLISHSFYPKITLPTRPSNKHGTLIDNFFCKLTEATIDTISGILIKKFSDHQPYFILLNNIQLKTDTPRFIKINKQDQESITKFQDEILNSSFLINLNDKSDPNNYNVLHNIIQNAFGLVVHEHSRVYIPPCPTYTHCIFVNCNILGNDFY